MGDNWEMPKPDFGRAKRLPKRGDDNARNTIDLIKAASASASKISLTGLNPFEPIKVKSLTGEEIRTTNISSVTHYADHDPNAMVIDKVATHQTNLTTTTFDPTPGLVQPTPGAIDSQASPSDTSPVLRGAQQDHYSERSIAQAQALKDEGHVVEGRDQFVVSNQGTTLKQSIESAKEDDSISTSSVGVKEVKSRFTKEAAAPDALAELGDPNIHPMRAMLRLDHAFGSHEWSSWEWETIELELSRVGVKVPPSNVDAIMAIKTLRNSDAFWTRYRAFLAVVVALGNRQVDFSTWNDVNIADIASAVDLVSFYVRTMEFSDEIKAYIAGVAIDNGFVVLPEQLSFAQEPFMRELERRLGREAATWQLRVRSALNAKSEELDGLGADVLAQVARLLRVAIFSSTRVQSIQG